MHYFFIGILIGEHLWGIAGMFLCIPAIAIIKIILKEFRDFSLGENCWVKKKTQ
jgi:predicted PurR-regulated permease PerM